MGWRTCCSWWRSLVFCVVLRAALEDDTLHNIDGVLTAAGLALSRSRFFVL